MKKKGKTRAHIPKQITKLQKEFADEYLKTFNASEAMNRVRPEMNRQTAGVRGSVMLKNPRVIEYIDNMNGELARTAQLPKLRLLLEQRAIAFGNIADVYKNWHELKDFESLSYEQKAAIAEIDCRVVHTLDRGGQPVETRFMRVRMHDKLKALENISKLLGYNEPEKIRAEVASINLVLGSNDLIDKMQNE
jgi:hypothetical protein